MESPDLKTLVATLASNGIEFVVVGGLAAVAQGAPFSTYDVDIVHRRTPENVARLVRVLVDVLDARYRDQTGRVIRPTEQILSGPGHSLLRTNLGSLDVLGAIEGGRDYDALLPKSLEISIAGHRVHVLGLETIVELKRGSTRPKDQLALLVLEESLQRSRERGG